MWRRGLAAVGVFAGCLFFAAAPAAAVFTSNTVGCAGSAVITDDKGATTSINANDTTVKVPNNGSAAWQGSVGTTTHNHSGKVTLKFGLFDIPLGDWGISPNAGNSNRSSGIKEIPAAVKQLPVGKYVVEGHHKGDEGGCAGKVTVEVEGSAFSTPAGIVSVVGALVSGAAFVFSGFAGAVKGALQ
jgi:hypothetical protein